MDEVKYQAIKRKVEREFPIRCQLSKMLGRPINPKNERQLLEFDSTIAELFLEISLKHPELMSDALTLIHSLDGKD